MQWIIDNSEILKIAIALIGLFSIPFALSQLIANKRSHLFAVYTNTMDRLDRQEVREARHFVYSLVNERENIDLRETLYKEQQWTAYSVEEIKGDPVSVQKCWVNRQRSELICRTFDQLGLLIRSGRVPLNLIAHFYTYPVLNCWYNLAPYIYAVRETRGQPGHMWEFENLVCKILIPGLESKCGVWEDVLDHDVNLHSVYPKIKKEWVRGPKDSKFNPGQNLWIVDRWTLLFRKLKKNGYKS